MTIVNVIEYNRLEMIKYNRLCDEWKKENSNNIIPQQAFFGFYTSQGNFRRKGYVAFGDKRAYFAKTRKEAIKRFNDKI